MWIPRDWGDGAATNDDGDGTWRAGLLGDGAIMLDGDGATPCAIDGGDARGKLAAPGDVWVCKDSHMLCSVSGTLSQ